MWLRRILLRRRNRSKRSHSSKHRSRSSKQRRERHRRNQVAMARAVARVGNNREVRQALHKWDGTQVERVACGRLEGANAPLTQDYVRVARVNDGAELCGHRRLILQAWEPWS